ncbi:hypothetical protein KUTeg_014529 [Tegillarca granosa]|uniref:ATP synthase F0 subunit 8 n=1 Tax=Tegillarca granosa TaxID=220873 RepID=A0ABQ9ESB1_TEGGR|nr:hypothetical protein KUTeg_014529 [Tegillarca granosa]
MKNLSITFCFLFYAYVFLNIFIFVTVLFFTFKNVMLNLTLNNPSPLCGTAIIKHANLSNRLNFEKIEEKKKKKKINQPYYLNVY